MRVVDPNAAVFDTMIRQSGLHFMRILNSTVCKGFGMIRKNAIDRALVHALDKFVPQFSAAELDK